MIQYISIYIEVDIIALVLLSSLFRKLGQEHSIDLDIGTIRWATLSLMLLTLTDIIWILGQNGLIGFSRIGNGFVNASYMTLTGVSTYLWFKYNEQRLQKWERYPDSLRMLFTIPCIVLFFMSFASIWTGWIFSIDADNTYHRGPLLPVQVAVSFLYLICAVLHDLINLYDEKNRARRLEDWILAGYAAIPLSAAIIQEFIPYLPLIPISSAISTLFLYSRIREMKISRDALTGLNNRSRADEYLESMINEKHDGMYFIMCDINYFKKINDTYGHSEGDRALTLTASAMKAVCNNYDAFLARYGGDEFCIVWEPPAMETPDELSTAIQDYLDLACKSADLKYEITVSFGWEQYREPMAFQDLIRRADRQLYKRKSQIHAADFKHEEP